MFALPRSRSRLQTGLIGLLLIAATIVAALLTVTGGASAQTLPLTRSMTATYDALTQQVTYTVTLTNPDAAPQGTTIFVFPDAPLLAAPLPGSHADWVFNNPTLQLTLAPIPPGERWCCRWCCRWAPSRIPQPSCRRSWRSSATPI